MPLTGMPILSTIVASSSGGMIWRIAFSISANCWALSSTRVPTRRAHMHQDLAGVDRRKEIAAEIGRQRERSGDEAEKAD